MPDMFAVTIHEMKWKYKINSKKICYNENDQVLKDYG